jgi:hypothetical protein
VGDKINKKVKNISNEIADEEEEDDVESVPLKV